MSDPGTFDAFGEPVAATQTRAPSRASAWLMRAGTTTFWLLVTAIVFARAVYFEPGVFSFEHAVAWAQGLFGLL